MTKYIEQPKLSAEGLPSEKRFAAGSQRSVARLRSLKFDPIERLVVLYQGLEKEDQYHRNVRDNIIVPLNARGKPVAYNAKAHSDVLAQMAKIGADLLRYNYGRVPETLNINPNSAPPVVINLTSNKGELTINKPPVTLEMQDLEQEDE